MKLNINTVLFAMIFVCGVLILFNQYQVSALSDAISGSSGGFKNKISFGLSGDTTDLSSVDTSQITSTAMAVATLFPELKDIQNEEDAIAVMIASGTPEYSEALGGITFDDPVTSMEYLAKWYHSLNQEVKSQHPEVWERYINLAARPTGISCEFCCGIGPQGIDSKGNSRCGCAHNPAVLALTQGLMLNTEYSDAEILREVMKWKSMFFPKNMVGIALEVAGQDPSSLAELPGMVGGC